MAGSYNKPLVLVISGHDPSGGAGIQADIETLASLGCHPLPLITALTAQNTARFVRSAAVEPALFEQQLSLVLEEFHPCVCKIGLVTSRAIIEILHRTLLRRVDVKLVIDPVLKSGSGTGLVEQSVRDDLLALLVPRSTVLTPNLEEALALGGSNAPDQAAQRLLALGCEYLLITGADTAGETVCNRLYGRDGDARTFEWPRLEGMYHGTGCTLAAAVSGFIARGADSAEAVARAQHYTWNTIRYAAIAGSGQSIPNRLFWGQYPITDNHDVPA